MDHLANYTAVMVHGAALEGVNASARDIGPDDWPQPVAFNANLEIVVGNLVRLADTWMQNCPSADTAHFANYVDVMHLAETLELLLQSVCAVSREDWKAFAALRALGEIIGAELSRKAAVWCEGVRGPAALKAVSER